MQSRFEPRQNLRSLTEFQNVLYKINQSVTVDVQRILSVEYLHFSKYLTNCKGQYLSKRQNRIYKSSIDINVGDGHTRA